MQSILFASILAFFTDPTGAPSCEDLLTSAEEEVLVCEEHLDVAHGAIEALVYSIDQLTSNPTGGGGAQQCNSQICNVVAACRRAGTSNLGQCVEEGCGGPLGCL